MESTQQETQQDVDATKQDMVATKQETAEAVQQNLAATQQEVQQELAATQQEVQQELAATKVDVQQEVEATLREVQQKMDATLREVQQEVAAKVTTLESLTSGAELKKCRELAAAVGKEVKPEMLVRFLRARNGSVKKATEMLQKSLAWREKTLPLDLVPEVQEELEKTKFSFYGRDNDGNMVLVVHVKRMGKHTYKDLAIVEQGLIHTAEYMENKLGPLEKMTVILSRIEATRENADLDWAKMVATLFQNNYPERLHRAVIAPVNLFVRSIWAVAQYFFEEETRKKVTLAKDTDVFLEIIPKHMLHVDLGGSSTDPFSIEEVVRFASFSNSERVVEADAEVKC